ncbi:hypothetical protein KQX54_014828, partial [Cotesia glomerata]
MQQNLIWTALAGVWIILIVSQAKEQFYYDNRTIETAINYPITHDESVSPPYDLSSSSSIALTSSPTRNSITVKSYRVNITLKTRNQIFSDTSNSSVEKIAIQTTANPSDTLNVLSYPRVNKFKTIESNPKTTHQEMTTIKTNFIEASTNILLTTPIKSSRQPHFLIQNHDNGLQVPANKITHSGSNLKSNKDKNNNGLDKHVEFRTTSEVSEMNNSGLLSLKNGESGEQNEDLSPETYTSLQDPNVSANNTLKKFKEAENEHQKQKNRVLGKVLGNLFGKLVRDKPPTSSANEKPRRNYLEAFVTSKPFGLMPSDATIWKVDKNSSNYWVSSSDYFLTNTDIDSDLIRSIPNDSDQGTDVPFTASGINEETKENNSTIFINVDESVTSRSEDSLSLLRTRENDSKENLTNVKTRDSETLGGWNNKEKLLPSNQVTDGKQLSEDKWNSGTPLSEGLSSDLLNSKGELQNSLLLNKTSTEAFNLRSLGINVTEKESPGGHFSHNNASDALKTGLDMGYYEENEFQLSNASKDSLLEAKGNSDLLVLDDTTRNWTVGSEGKSATKVPVSSKLVLKVGGSNLKKGNETNFGVIKSTQIAAETGKIKSNGNQSLATVNQWPVKHSVIVEGDLVLGGLMMVHEREDTITCGPVMPQGGVQALEAMLFTLDWLSKQQFIPGVKIGAHILDDCDKDTYGLEMAVDFIK